MSRSKRPCEHCGRLVATYARTWRDRGHNEPRVRMHYDTRMIERRVMNGENPWAYATIANAQHIRRIAAKHEGKWSR